MSDGITDAMRPLREHWTAIEARKKRDIEIRKEEREKVLEQLEEFTWLRYKENRIEKEGLEEHCIIRGEILRLKAEIRQEGKVEK